MRWSGGAKVSCISRHWGVQLISAYSWARPAILVAGKGRGGMFLFLLFLHFHSCSSFFPSLLFSSLLLSLLSLFSLSLGDDTKWPTRVDVSLNPNTINCQHLDRWLTYQKNIQSTLVISNFTGPDKNVRVISSSRQPNCDVIGMTTVRLCSPKRVGRHMYMAI